MRTVDTLHSNSSDLRDFFFLGIWIPHCPSFQSHYLALSKKPLILTGQFPEAIHSFPNIMDASYLSSTGQALEYFAVDENQGLSEQQIQRALGKYGRNGTVHHHISV